MTFNFSSDARIITLSDLDSINTEGLVFGRCAEWSAKKFRLHKQAEFLFSGI